MKERIIEFLKAENKSSAQFAEEIGVQPSGISHILSGRNNPSLDFVLKMLEKYKFLSTDWLLFGKGTMYREPEMQKLFETSFSGGSESDKPVISEAIRPEPKQKVAAPDDAAEMVNRRNVNKIVLFYSDSTFSEFHPGDH